MRTATIILGVLAALMGVLWVGQGLGFIHWPAQSFMIDQKPWAERGAILTAVGVILLWIALRRSPR